jgi:hypothetical protein
MDNIASEQTTSTEQPTSAEQPTLAEQPTPIKLQPDQIENLIMSIIANSNSHQSGGSLLSNDGDIKFFTWTIVFGLFIQLVQHMSPLIYNKLQQLWVVNIILHNNTKATWNNNKLNVIANDSDDEPPISPLKLTNVSSNNTINAIIHVNKTSNSEENNHSDFFESTTDINTLHTNTNTILRVVQLNGAIYIQNNSVWYNCMVVINISNNHFCGFDLRMQRVTDNEILQHAKDMIILTPINLVTFEQTLNNLSRLSNDTFANVPLITTNNNSIVTYNSPSATLHAILSHIQKHIPLDVLSSQFTGEINSIIHQLQQQLEHNAVTHMTTNVPKPAEARQTTSTTAEQLNSQTPNQPTTEPKPTTPTPTTPTPTTPTPTKTTPLRIPGLTITAENKQLYVDYVAENFNALMKEQSKQPIVNGQEIGILMPRIGPSPAQLTNNVKEHMNTYLQQFLAANR